MGRRPKNADVVENTPQESKEVEKASKTKDEREVLTDKKILVYITNLLENLATAFGTDFQDMAISYINLIFKEKKVKQVVIDNYDEFEEGLSENTLKLLKDVTILKNIYN